MASAHRPPGLPRWAGRYVQQWTAAVLATYGTTCHLCRTDGATTADHLIPRSKGGGDTLGNMRPAHQACNSARGDMDLGEWFAKYPIPHRPALPPSARWR